MRKHILQTEISHSNESLFDEPDKFIKGYEMGNYRHYVDGE
jgi:hypothetical protein